MANSMLDKYLLGQNNNVVSNKSSSMLDKYLVGETKNAKYGTTPKSIDTKKKEDERKRQEQLLQMKKAKVVAPVSPLNKQMTTFTPKPVQPNWSTIQKTTPNITQQIQTNAPQNAKIIKNNPDEFKSSRDKYAFTMELRKVMSRAAELVEAGKQTNGPQSLSDELINNRIKQYTDTPDVVAQRDRMTKYLKDTKADAIKQQGELVGQTSPLISTGLSTGLAFDAGINSTLTNIAQVEALALGSKNAIQDVSPSETAYTSISSQLKGVQKILADSSYSLGSNALPIIAGAITGSRAVGSGMIGLTSGGQAYKQYRDEGKTHEQALSYMMVSALSNAGMSYALSPIVGGTGEGSKGLVQKAITKFTPQMIGTVEKVAQKVSTKPFIQALTKVLMNGTIVNSGETVEEILQQGVDVGYRNLVDKQGIKAGDAFEQIAYAGLLGFLAPMGMYAPKMVGEFAQDFSTISKKQSFVSSTKKAIIEVENNLSQIEKLNKQPAEIKATILAESGFNEDSFTQIVDSFKQQREDLYISLIPADSKLTLPQDLQEKYPDYAQTKAEVETIIKNEQSNTNAEISTKQGQTEPITPQGTTTMPNTVNVAEPLPTTAETASKTKTKQQAENEMFLSLVPDYMWVIKAENVEANQNNNNLYSINAMDKEQALRNFEYQHGKANILSTETLYDYRKKQLEEVPQVQEEPQVNKALESNVDNVVKFNPATPTVKTELNPVEKQAVDLMKNKFNRDVIIATDIPKGRTGYTYDGKIYAATSEDGINLTLGHEATHLIQGTSDGITNSKQYNRFTQLVVDEFIGREEFAKLTENTKELYKEVEPNQTTQHAENEVIAEWAGQNLFNNVDTINRLAIKNRGLAVRIKSVIHSMGVKLTGSPEAKRLLNAENLYRDALKQADKAFKKENKSQNVSNPKYRVTEEPSDTQINKETQNELTSEEKMQKLRDAKNTRPGFVVDKDNSNLLYSEEQITFNGEKYPRYKLAKYAKDGKWKVLEANIFGSTIKYNGDFIVTTNTPKQAITELNKQNRRAWSKEERTLEDINALKDKLSEYKNEFTTAKTPEAKTLYSELYNQTKSKLDRLTNTTSPTEQPTPKTPVQKDVEAMKTASNPVENNKTVEPLTTEQQKKYDYAKGVYEESTGTTKIEAYTEQFLRDYAKNPKSTVDMIDKFIVKQLKEFGGFNKDGVTGVDIPLKVNGKPTSQFWATFAANVSDEVYNYAAQNVVAKELASYEVQSNPETEAKARKFVADNIDNLAGIWQNIVSHSDVKVPGTRQNMKPVDRIAIGEVMLVEAMNSGATKAAMSISADVAMLATDFGQAIQAINIFKNMTGSGQLIVLNKIIEKVNTEHTKDIEDKKMQPVELPKGIQERLISAKNLDERNAIMEEAKQIIAYQIPANWVDKFTAWRYLSMLGNPKTHIRNMVGNSTFIPIVKLKDTIAFGLESAVNQISPNGIDRTKSIKKDSEMKTYAKNEAKDIVKTLQSSGKYNNTQSLSDLSQVFDNNTLEYLRKGNMDLLEWEDGIALKYHYSNALAQGLTVNKFTTKEINSLSEFTRGKPKYDKNGVEIKSNEQKRLELLKRIRLNAFNQAQKNTYREYSQLAQGIQNLSNSGKMSKIIIESALPFKKTPINLLKRGVEYSPIGLVKGLVDINKVKSGEITAADAIDKISAGITGSVALIALGYALSSIGMIIGGLSKDRNEEDLLKEKGKLAYSIHIGDTDYSIDWLAPISTPLFVGVKFHELIKDGAPQWKDVYNALWSIGEPLYNTTFLQGINNIFNSAKYSEPNEMFPDITKTLLQGYANQFVPTVFGQIARTIDSERRTTATSNASVAPDDVQYFMQKVANKLPVVNKLLPSTFQTPIYQDIWGEKVEQPNIAIRGLQNFISPAYISNTKELDSKDKQKVIDSKLITAMIKLNKVSEAASVLPTVPKKNLKYDSKEYTLTVSQQTNLKSQVGKVQKQAATEFIVNNEMIPLTYKNKYDKEVTTGVSYNKVYNASAGKYTDDDLKAKALDKVMQDVYENEVAKFVKANKLIAKK